MIREKTIESSVLIVHLAGRLDSVTTPQVEKELKTDVASVRALVLDFKDLEYVSSAGLRMILKLHKKMKKKDGMTIKNVNKSIMEVFALTKFAEILRIE